MGCIISRRSEEGEMSSSRSPAAAVLDDDDLLSEILLRLPPQPSSLPRASLVCKRWRCLVSDPGFTNRFRLRHRRRAPLLGFFYNDYGCLHFVHTLEAPNRVHPRHCVSLQLDDSDRFPLLGCRHGLALFFDASRKQILVWDPVTADQHCIAIPAGFYKTVNLGGFDTKAIHGAVVRSAEDAQHFQVVLAAADDKDKQHSRALACFYSSNTGLWENLVSTPMPSDTYLSNRPFIVKPGKPARLVGNSLYWLLDGNFLGLLEFDLERQNLTVIPVPVDVYAEENILDFLVMRAEGGGLGLFVLSHFATQLWKRTTNGDGAASWVLGRTIELDKLLSLDSELGHLCILGYAEDNNVVFLWRNYGGLFMIHLESLQFQKPSGNYPMCSYHPFESVYAAGIQSRIPVA
ncbi:unnamed protein product [Alopecurus aequalis]